jgi:hypothetical protein
VSSAPTRYIGDRFPCGLQRTERGTEERLGEWEPEPQLVQPEVLLEDISPVIKDIKGRGRHCGEV